MEPLLIKEICGALGSNVIDTNSEITSISTDSRKLEAGCLFIALRGNSFDANVYIDKAFENGASFAVCNSYASVKSGNKNKCIFVEDTEKALLKLASYYRDKFDIKLVGVTGSVGKTTTKEMIACVLSCKYKTLKTIGNFNNQIGLPLTLFRLDSSYEAAVIEMGMSNLGEISVLSKAAKPEIAVISNIGVSHLENLKTREYILKAKLEILDGLKKGSRVIINYDNDLLVKIHLLEDFELLTFGINNKSANIIGKDIVFYNDKTTFSIIYENNTYSAVIPCIGEHNVLNALSAFAVGISLKIGPKDAARSLSNYIPSGMRQRIVEKGGYNIIEDCYNASPDSMKASLTALSHINTMGRKIAVLSDMLELGDISKDAHYELGRQVLENKINIVFYTGNFKEDIKRGAGDVCRIYEDKEKLFKALIQEIKINDTILFKASRGMALEEVIEKLYGAIKNNI